MGLRPGTLEAGGRGKAAMPRATAVAGSSVLVSHADLVSLVHDRNGRCNRSASAENEESRYQGTVWLLSGLDSITRVLTLVNVWTHSYGQTLSEAF